jgi:hypothetical protein
MEMTNDMFDYKVIVQHWRYEDGGPGYPESNIKRDPLPRGWYCWVFARSQEGDFKNWMTKNCPTAEVEYRFNYSDPMFTVYIKDEKEAMIFTLRWK